MVFGADAQEAKTTSSQNAYYAFTPSKWESRQHQYGLFAEGTIRATESTLVTWACAANTPRTRWRSCPARTSRPTVATT